MTNSDRVILMIWGCWVLAVLVQISESMSRIAGAVTP